MNWRDTQQAFAEAVRDPNLDVPVAVGPQLTEPPVARFNVYRNNSAVSLTEAMADSFPVVRDLVGEEFFTAMAQAYVADNAPASPVLIHYGGDFPAFIDGFEPARSLPFLGDVARVEWAWVQAYHAADNDSVSADALQAINPEQLDDARLNLHPSAMLLQSRFPAISIWSAHQLDDAGERQQMLDRIAASDTAAGECGLIVRPEFEVNVQLVEPAILRLLQSFKSGATLAEAAEVLDDEDAENFGGMLGYIFSIGAVASINLD